MHPALRVAFARRRYRALKAIKAAVCRSFGEPLVIEELYLQAPGEGEIEVRLAACAICHSDLSAAEGLWGGVLPAVYGHEAAGVISDCGPTVSDFAPGDRVLVTLIRSCGECPSCSQGAPTSCDHAWDDVPSPIRNGAGIEVTRGMNTGAFAERVVVDASQCVLLPHDLPFDVAALLACGVITGFGAVTNTAQLQEGQSAAVVGVGGVGLNAVQAAALSGASQVIALDLEQQKLAAAIEFGATAGVLADDDRVVEKVKELTAGRGVDFVFVTVGAPRAFEAAPELLAPGGAVVLVGMPATGDTAAFDIANLAAMNQSLLGSRMGQTVLGRDIPRLIELWRQKRLKLEPLVSHRYPLEQINQAMAETRKGVIRRNVIVFDSALPVDGGLERKTS